MKQIYDYAMIAAATGHNAQTLRVMQARGRMPKPDYRLGQSPGWDPATIEPWINENRNKAGFLRMS